MYPLDPKSVCVENIDIDVVVVVDIDTKYQVVEWVSRSERKNKDIRGGMGVAFPAIYIKALR